MHALVVISLVKLLAVTSAYIMPGYTKKTEGNIVIRQPIILYTLDVVNNLFIGMDRLSIIDS